MNIRSSQTRNSFGLLGWWQDAPEPHGSGKGDPINDGRMRRTRGSSCRRSSKHNPLSPRWGKVDAINAKVCNGRMRRTRGSWCRRSSPSNCSPLRTAPSGARYSLSLAHTHTHAHTLSLSLTHTLSLSLSHTHTGAPLARGRSSRRHGGPFCPVRAPVVVYIRVTSNDVVYIRVTGAHSWRVRATHTHRMLV